MIEKLEYFLGKICTIIIQSSSLPLKDGIQHSQYFTGKVIEIDETGIWLQHLQVNTLAYYSFPVLGIVEERFVSKDDPQAEKIQKDLQKKPVPPKAPSQHTFIPVESLNKIIKKN